MVQEQHVDLRTCAKECNNCHAVCQQTLAHCISQGGKHVEERHLQILLDCIDACGACASICNRNSQNCEGVCRACAELCRLCADSCDAFDDDQMKQCAEACRRCADHCQEMVA